jgi:hypothetical protein
VSRFNFYGLQRGRIPYGCVATGEQPGPTYHHYAAFVASNDFLEAHSLEMTEFVRTMCQGKASALKIYDWFVATPPGGMTRQLPVVGMFFTSRDDLMLFKIRFADHLLKTDSLSGEYIVRPRAQPDRRH